MFWYCVSQHVADDVGSSGAGFFYLNQPYDSDSSDFAEHTQSNGDCAEKGGSIDEDVSSQLVVPDRKSVV